MDYEEMLGEFNSRTRLPNNKNSGMLKSLLSAGSGILGTVLQNVFNTRQMKETNKANREMVAMQNAAQAKESEKAYQRSLPIMQTNAMEQAGMSKAGAINALNGGGSYQAAPVNAAQDQAPQIDVTQAINAIQASAQLAEQRRQFNAQHNLAQRQQAFEEKKYDDLEQVRKQELSNLIKQGKVLDNTARKLGFEAKFAESNAEIQRLQKDVLSNTYQNEIDATNAESLARKINAENRNYIEQLRKTALTELSSEQLKEVLRNMAEREFYSSTIEMFATTIKEKGYSVARKLFQEALTQSLTHGAPVGKF